MDAQAIPRIRKIAPTLWGLNPGNSAQETSIISHTPPSRPRVQCLCDKLIVIEVFQSKFIGGVITQCIQTDMDEDDDSSNRGDPLPSKESNIVDSSYASKVNKHQTSRKYQAVIFNAIDDCKLTDYLLALGPIVGPKNIIQDL
ncbi:hypothetical protein HHI36_014263 [Cryptolaemus montrouzieri]|uniref:Uncharacterized protein n=1 Tax=Cryptolaemus montrouzieri TaxID=559131 RepID=A0ABD2N289_9CUCU